MSEHLTENDVDLYQRRSLPPARLLDVDDHLSGCEECRSRLEQFANPAESVDHIRRNLKPTHLSYEQIEAYADDRLDDAWAREHLRDCAGCRAEGDDLRALAGQTAAVDRWSWWQSMRPWHVGMGLAAVVAIVIILIAIPREVRRADPPKVAAVLKAPMPDEYLAMLERAVSAGRVEVPSGILALPRARGVLRGSHSARAELRDLHPTATAALADRPEFHWEPVPNAQWYRVSIYDDGYQPVLESEKLTNAQWRPEKPLARGRMYSWQVTARIGGREVRAPKPPEPEAQFQILPAQDADRIERLRAQHPEAHVLQGIALAHAGALDEASAELRKAIASGDQPDRAKALLSSLP